MQIFNSRYLKIKLHSNCFVLFVSKIVKPKKTKLANVDFMALNG